MELLLRICTWRNLALAAALAAAASLAFRFQEHPRRWYRDWRYPPQGSAGPGGEEIMRLKDKHESLELARRHRRVAALLDRAAAEGFDVAALRAQADSALQLDDARSRPRAAAILAQVELAIPHKKVRYAAVASEADDEDIPSDVRPLVTGGKGKKRR